MKRDVLLQRVYEQLRRQAQGALRKERPDHTLTATALVHEAYLRLGDSFANQAHFYAAAGESMRRILVDSARARMAHKRGGDGAARGKRVDLTEAMQVAIESDPAEILALDAALSRLEKGDPQAANVVRLRFFAGLGVEETALAMGVSPRTVKRDWQFARAFLYRELSGERPAREALPGNVPPEEPED